MDVTRRETLLTTGAALGLAGCFGDSPGSTGTNTSDTDGNGNGNSGSDDVEYEVFQLGPSFVQPLWVAIEDTTGFITLLKDEYDDVWMVENPEEIDGLQSWLDETDSGGPRSST
jgi:hypothetical protein